MKKLLFVLMICTLVSLNQVFAAETIPDTVKECAGNETKMVVGSPVMNACGVIKEIDEGGSVCPIIDSGYTLVPIRAVIEAFGGGVYWDGDRQEVNVFIRENAVIMTINSEQAEVYSGDVRNTVTLPVAPKIIDGRTMLPLRFVSENCGLKVDWDEQSHLITITQPKSEPVTFANVDGSFYPIGDMFDMRLGADDAAVYSYGENSYRIETDIVSTEAVEWESGEFDFYNPQTTLSTVSINGEKYSVSNVFNLEYVGVADLTSNMDGFEIIIIDSGMSSDYTADIYTYNNSLGLSHIGSYSGMAYNYYENGTATVYCDGSGRIINQYTGFTAPMYALCTNTVRGDSEMTECEVNIFDEDVIGKELVFGGDLFASYIEVGDYPENFSDIWSLYTEDALTTVTKGTPVVIDNIRFHYDESDGERYIMGYYVRIDGKKYVMELQYAG